MAILKVSENENVLKIYDSFLWIRFNSLNFAEPLRGEFTFNLKSPGVPGNRSIDLGRVNK